MSIISVSERRDLDVRSDYPKLLPFLSAAGPAVIVCIGWVWARMTVATFQHREGYKAIGNSVHGDFYAFWSMDLPFYTVLIVLFMLGLVVSIGWYRRKRLWLIWAVWGYEIVLVLAYISGMAGLSFEAFD